MGFFSRWFGGSNQRAPAVGYTEVEVQVIAQSTQRMIDVVNESIDLARKSSNPKTKLSRLGVAKERFEQLQAYTRRYPFLTLYGVDDLRAIIAELEINFTSNRYAEIADANEEGQRLEKSGDIDGAIAAYERLATEGVDTPFTYRRLAILYRKTKQRDDEIRILKRAMKCIPKRNAQHRLWFSERLNKLVDKH